MATFTLTEITPTGATYGMAVWRLANGTPQVTYMTQAEFVAWNALGEPPGKPTADAAFLLAGDGLPVFNTPSGRPRVGDFWVRNTATREVVLYFGDEPNWDYSLAVADDPLAGQTSRLNGFAHKVSGNTFITTLTNAHLTSLRAGTLTVTVRGIPIVNNSVTIPNNYVRRLNQSTDTVITNHRSVTFDASSNAGADTNTLAWSHTVASQSDRYLVAGCAWRQRAITAATYNGVSLTDRVATNAGDARCNIRDIVAPDTGANNVSFTMNLSASYMSGAAISAYGVDQATPTTDTDSVEGSSTSPAITLSSAASEIGFTMLSWASLSSETNTPDATWTAITANISAVNSGQGAYKTGAASITRTDTLSASTDWCIQGVAIKAGSAPAGNTSSFFGLF